MPQYHFQCAGCMYRESIFMSIPEFIKSLKEETLCPRCKEPTFNNKVGKVHGKVQKDIHEMKRDIEEEAREIIEKVKSGDEEAIRDIYGEKENTLK